MTTELPSSDNYLLSRLPRRRVVLVACMILLLPTVGYGLAWWGYRNPSLFQVATSEQPETQEATTDPLEGEKLFTQHCAYCHGSRGTGQGVAHLDPPARYFGGEHYKFSTTQNKVPTDDDLLRLIRAGIPNSAMPGFPELREEELRAIIAHVRRMTKQGLYDREVKQTWLADFGEELGESPKKLFEELAKKLPGSIFRGPWSVNLFFVIAKLFDAEDLKPRYPQGDSVWPQIEKAALPGDKLARFDYFPPSAESIARGKLVFAKAGCAGCHGNEGRGDGPQVATLKNDNGTAARPRDLTLGVYKAGGEPQHLFARIWNGIPGTPMPETKTLSHHEMVDLIHFIKSLPRRDDLASSEAKRR